MTPGAGEEAVSAVAELQGWDGAFSFEERLLQRIWLAGDFDRSRLLTEDGRTVRVLHPGKWNRLGGPDFLNAKLDVAGVTQIGDIEIHLRASDWDVHGHASDPNYRGVILHVVLFPPRASFTAGWEGKSIPVAALLPLLYRSLEEHVDEDAVERLANHPFAAATDRLSTLPAAERRREVESCSRGRWHQKVRFAALRMARLGWTEACHCTALEILGYRFNRGPMLALAGEHPLSEWLERDPKLVDTWCDAAGERWSRQPCRPANQPRRRLRQYAQWVHAIPNWPERLAAFSKSCPARESGAVGGGSADLRRRLGLPRVAEHVAREVCAEAVGGTRQHTLVCDGLLPLAAAALPERADALYRLWHSWYPGDLPHTLPLWLSRLGLSDRTVMPVCNGLAQGLLGWVWREEERSHQMGAWPCGRGT